MQHSLNPQGTTLVIGIANEDRGNDAVGLLIASRLKHHADDNLKTLEWRGDGIALIEAWKSADTVIIIDTAVSGADSGTIHRIDATAQPMPTNLLRCSTHAFGVAEAVELARALGGLPRRVIVYGIEGESFDAGRPLSPSVEKAARRVEDLVSSELGDKTTD